MLHNIPRAAAVAVMVGLTLSLLDLATAGAASAKSDRIKASSTVVAVLPVVSCSTSYGVGSGSNPYVPRQLPAATSVRGLSFYSNGLITVLGPAGWTCGALVAADGGQRLDVYPPGQPDYATHEAPKGAALVQVDRDYTGHGPGAEDVCALFPHSGAASFVNSSGLPCPTPPARESHVQLTDDVLTFSDPSGVAGTGAGSGGTLVSMGAVVYPQVGSGAASVNIALLSCSLPRRYSSVCDAVRSDFLIRNPPSYTGPGG